MPRGRTAPPCRAPSNNTTPRIAHAQQSPAPRRRAYLCGYQALALARRYAGHDLHTEAFRDLGKGWGGVGLTTRPACSSAGSWGRQASPFPLLHPPIHSHTHTRTQHLIIVRFFSMRITRAYQELNLLLQCGSHADSPLRRPAGTVGCVLLLCPSV